MFYDTLFCLWLIILENELDDFPYTIKPHIFSEQSPINIITKNVSRLPLPHLHCHYLRPFNTAIAELTNSGTTSKIIHKWFLLNFKPFWW